MGRILITWASWYIAQNLTMNNVFLWHDVINFEGDLQDTWSYSKYYKQGISHILHLWTLNNRNNRGQCIKMYQQTNIDSINSLLELSNQNNDALLLNFSSTSNYKIQNIPKQEISNPDSLISILKKNPDLDKYSLSKSLAENILLWKDKTISIRLPSVSSKKWNVMDSFVEKISENQPICINTAAEIDFISISNVSELVKKLLWQESTNYYNGKTQIIGTWEKIDLNTLVQVIKVKSGLSSLDIPKLSKTNTNHFLIQLWLNPTSIEEQIVSAIKKRATKI